LQFKPFRLLAKLQIKVQTIDKKMGNGKGNQTVSVWLLNPATPGRANTGRYELSLGKERRKKHNICGQKKGPFVVKQMAVRKNLAVTYSPTLLCAVPSAMRGLTSEFGMGSGISLSPVPPSKNNSLKNQIVKTIRL
jgi:hypothetical protein